MAKAAGPSKQALVKAMGASAALYGAAGLLAPHALAKAYAVPDTPHTAQLLRLFGSRMLALAAWTFTARSQEEVHRLLSVAAGMCGVDTVTALAAAGSTGRSSAVRAAATNGTFAVLAVAIRSLED